MPSVSAISLPSLTSIPKYGTVPRTRVSSLAKNQVPTNMSRAISKDLRPSSTSTISFRRCHLSTGRMPRLNAVSGQESLKSVTIDNVVYNVSAANISDHQQTVVLGQTQATNNSSQEQSITMQINYNISELCKWSSSSYKPGVKLSMEAGIPYIADDGTVQVSEKKSINTEWDAPYERSFGGTVSTTVSVPPGSTVNATLEATKGSFTVPFTFTTAAGGRADGLFTGENVFGNKFVITDRSA